MGVVSELLSLISLVLLIINYREHGVENVYSASFLASTFFFFTCGFVLLVIAKVNVPNLGFDGPEFDGSTFKDGTQKK